MSTRIIHGDCRDVVTASDILKRTSYPYMWLAWRFMQPYAEMLLAADAIARGEDLRGEYWESRAGSALRKILVDLHPLIWTATQGELLGGGHG